ncbi:MAG: reverse transcriptase-like protein [Candidatus Acidiferrales bacterium]
MIRKVPPPPSSARLFPDTSAAPPAGVHIANVDGASRGNPGPASYAVVVRNADGEIVEKLAKNIGSQTNNVAEYFGLIAALDYATSHNIRALRIRSDSELLVRQMQGRYKVKSPDLKPLFERAAKLAKQIPYFTIEHVRREYNADADALANVALDSAGVPNYEGSVAKAHAAPKPAFEKLRALRARVSNGALQLWDPLDLPEGTEVQLDIRILNKK